MLLMAMLRINFPFIRINPPFNFIPKVDVELHLDDDVLVRKECRRSASNCVKCKKDTILRIGL